MNILPPSFCFAWVSEKPSDSQGTDGTGILSGVCLAFPTYSHTSLAGALFSVIIIGNKRPFQYDLYGMVDLGDTR